SGLDAEHRHLQIECCLLAPRDEGKRYGSFFNILNTPLAIAMQRSLAVTSVVRKIRLRVTRTTRGFDIRISPILPLSTKCTSNWTVARVGRPDTYRAVMPQLRSAKVITNPPCTRPRRL